MEGLFMTGALRLWAASLVAAFTLTCAQAAEPTPAPPPPPPPPEPLFYVHVGALGVFTQDNANSTGGGFFNTVEPINPLGLPGPLAVIQNVETRPQYTLGYEIGYFVTPNISLSLFSGVPPLIHVKATGVAVLPDVPGINHGLAGSDLLGSVRYGPADVQLQYHFTQFGALVPQLGALVPYLGVGGAYVLNLGNISDGILRNFSVDQNFAFNVQGGADWMLTPNWGVFVDAKKFWYTTDAQGFLLNTNVPIRVHTVLDPWVAMAGITFKY
jgi:outer membrane protein